MTNVYIKTVNGGETMSLTGAEAVELDNGTVSTWISLTNILQWARPLITPWTYSSASVTTSNVTAVEGTFHNLDVSGMTANRDFNLPTPSAAGVRCGVRLSAGDDTYALLLKINGTEWSRIFITNETVVFVATGTGAGNWVVEQDGRKACHGLMERITSNITTNTAATQTTPDWNSARINVGDVCDLTNNRFNIRRTGNYEFSAEYTPAAGMNDQKYARIYILQNSTNIAHAGARQSTTASSSLALAIITSNSYSLTAGDTLTYQFSTEEADMGMMHNGTAGFEGSNFFKIKEAF